MIAHKLPERPWQNHATDLFIHDNGHYLIEVDYYSRYFELKRMSTTTSSAVINKLKAIFAGLAFQRSYCLTMALNSPHRNLFILPMNGTSVTSQAAPHTLL